LAPENRRQMKKMVRTVSKKETPSIVEARMMMPTEKITVERKNSLEQKKTPGQNVMKLFFF
jgi:hypothetical protein